MSQVSSSVTNVNGINSRLNSVQYIITNFSSFSLKQKIGIKALGRPTPELKLTQNCSKKKEGRSFIRHFNERMYQKNKWICGCDIKNSLFCFPCLLFYSSNKDRSWSRIGVTDLNHLQEKIRKHELSKSHLQACMELALLAQVSIVKGLNCIHSLEIAEHNESVKKNRHILHSLINVVKFCGIFNLALRHHDVRDDSLSRGIFKELMNYSAEFDIVLKQHIRNSTVFKGHSNSILNEILDCMLTVCKTEILKEVASADFLAVQCDVTTNVSNHCQMAIILRYVKDNNTHEHFWTFVPIFDETPTGLVKSIRQEIDPILRNNTNKLIAFAYSGVNIMKGSIGDVHVEILAKYPYAYLVHCYADHLNLIIQKVASQNTQVRVFFNDLSRIQVFLSNTNRFEMLAKIVKMKLSSVSATQWTYNSRIVNTVYENRDNIILCLQKISEKVKHKITGREASGLVKILEDCQFMFWLTFFQKVYPHVDKFYIQPQSKHIDDNQLKKTISKFEACIRKIRQETEEIEQEWMTENIDKRKRLDEKDRSSKIAKKICDVIVTQLKATFSFRGHLEAKTLVTNISYSSFNEIFPNELLNNVAKLYPMLSKERLKTELELVYSRTEFSQIETSTNILEFISRNKLESTFPELVKLLRIIMTTPMSTDEPQRCFSTLKKLKIFLRKSVSDDRLDARAMMSINRNFLGDIPKFDEKVFDLFVNLENRRIDFLFKD